MSMIRVENISKSFGSLEVLKDVSLTVEKGERIVIIGESGGGKSVFLRSMDLLEVPDKGSIYIGDDELTSPKADLNRIRRRVGFVYQGFHLFSHLCVLDNITLAPIRLLKMKRAEAEEKALKLLRMVGLESKKHAMPDVLSGGQKQRIAIVRSLIMEPEVMLFDEPTSALDPTMVGEVLATLRLLAKSGMTMVIVTHEMSFAREIATRILYMDEKGIYEEGTPQEIFDDPKRKKTRDFIHKMKYLSYKIDSRSFDLMQLQGSIRDFASKYGIDEKKAYRLQLCTEELIYEMLDYGKSDCVDMSLELSFDEKEKSSLIRLSSKGVEYNPFEKACDGLGDGIHGKADVSVGGDDMVHLGITILKNTAKRIEYRYDAGNRENLFEIEI